MISLHLQRLCSIYKRDDGLPTTRSVRLWTLYLLVSIALNWTLPGKATGASTSRLVDEGNAALAEGNYRQAITKYDEATVNLPESPHILFNKGTALYHLKEYAEAKKTFQDAAVKTRNVSLEARCEFNLGNIAFRNAERQRDNNQEASLSACQESIRHYQASLKLDPKNQQAAENIEVVRLTVKAILDEIQKQKEEQEQQQKLQEKLSELIKRQEKITDETVGLNQETEQEPASSKNRSNLKALQDEQEEIYEQTRELHEQLKQHPPSSGQPTPSASALPHIEDATQHQQAALNELRDSRLEDAIPHEQKALESLQAALDSLGGNQDQTGPKDTSQENNSAGTQHQPADQPRESPDEQSQQQPQNPQPQTEPLDERAEAILDEERENQARRQQLQPRSARPVDKDW